MFKFATPLLRGIMATVAGAALCIGIVYAAGYHVAEKQQTEPTQVTVEMMADYYLPDNNPAPTVASDATTGPRAKLRNTDPHRNVLAEKPAP